jgi:hypothetical protein
MISRKAGAKVRLTRPLKAGFSDVFAALVEITRD